MLQFVFLQYTYSSLLYSVVNDVLGNLYCFFEIYTFCGNLNLFGTYILDVLEQVLWNKSFETRSLEQGLWNKTRPLKIDFEIFWK